MKLISCPCSPAPTQHDDVPINGMFRWQCRNCMRQKVLEIITRIDAKGRKKNPVPKSKLAQLKSASKIYEDFTGYDAAEKIKIDKPDFPDVLCVIGDIDEIFYTTDRDGAIEKYRHKFAKNSRPLFCVAPDGEQIFMIGGSFKFTERGIVDTPQKKR